MLLFGLALLLVALLAACGEPDTNEQPGSATPTADPDIILINRYLATAGLPTVDPHMSAAKRREVVNRRNVQLGRPTLDPSISDAEYTATVESKVRTLTANETPMPTPTPKRPSCGPHDGPTGGEAIVAQYGGVYTDCARYGGKWVITTFGTDTSPGIIAVLDCPEGDDPCERGEDPASDVEWLLLTLPGAPNGSLVKITGSDGVFGLQEATALTLNFGCGFSLVTYEIRCHATWRDFVTSTPQ
jgi:hypothetical protein